MKVRNGSTGLAIALLLGPLLTSTAAAACAYLGAPVAAVLKKKVGVFRADGKFLKDVDAGSIAPGAVVLDCNEELGIVKLRIDGLEQWADRLSLDIPASGRKPDCIARAVSRDSDVTAPVSSGVGESCAPGGK